MSSLVVPVVVWGGGGTGQNSPTHRVSSLLLTPDCTTLISGSVDGHIILWKLKLDQTLWNAQTEATLEPISVLLGHTAQVTALCVANEANAPISATSCAVGGAKGTFLSASENGDVCLWDISDGRCLEVNRFQGHHIGMQRLPVREQSGIRVLVWGYYSDILVIDGCSLCHLFSLSSRLHPDWASAVTLVRPIVKAEDVVVALTLSGHVKVWSLSSTDRKEMEFIPEEQSKSIRCMNPCHMTCCSANQKLLLIITEAEWFLYDLDDFVKLCGGIAPPHPASTTGGASCVVHTWSRGSFLTVDKIAVWTKQGMCVVYQLPPDVNPENKRYRSKLDSSKEEHLKILASFDAHEDYIRSQKESKSEDDENGLKMFDFDSATNILAPDCVSASQFSNMGFVFASGNEEGFLSIHVLPSSILSIDGKTKNWDPSMLNKKIHCLSSTSLAHVWEKFKPSGLVDHLVDENGASHKVTSSLYLAQYGNLACGREDGSIVLIPAIEHAALKLLAPQYTKQLGLPSYFVMRGGHYSKVTCLLYPYQDSHRYDRSLFVSGGMDFSVVIWNLLSGQLIRRFVNHAGQVERLFIPPDTCGPRIRQCVVSVSSDHGVNLTSLSERNTILMAGCHLFPVKTVKWKPSHDFMLVQTTDGTLYVWHLSSGYLDRVIQGSEAEDILSACDEMEHEVTIRGNLKDAFKRRNVDALKDMAIQQITDLAVQEKVGVNSRGDSNRKRDGAGTSASPSGSFSGLNICPIRLSDGDPFFHVLFFDTEALVIQLLNCDKRRPTTSSSPPATPVASEKFKPEFERLEEVRRLTQSSSNFTDKVSKLGNKLLENVKKEIVSTTATAQTQMQGTNLQSSSDSSSAAEAHSNRKPTSNMSLPLVDVEGYLESSQDDAADFEKQRTQKQTPALDPAQQEAEQEQLTCETAQLMMSLLFAWGFNPSLDRLCVELLGLFRPSDSVCFGVTSRPGYLTLSLPSPKTISERHWSVSSSLTTQHRLSIITLSNALMSMRVPILAQKLLDKVGPSSYPDIFQGWSSVAALHCVLFPDMAPGEAQMADLEQLVRRWQDRCLEVREAAQALLLAELKHIGSRGRQNLVDIWASHLPLLGSDPNNQHPPQPSNTLPTPQGSSTSFSNASSVASSPKHSGVQPGVHAANSSYPQSTGQMQGDNHSDGNSVDDDDSLGSMTAITSASNPTQSTKLSRHEAQRRQGTAIVMLGVLGAEFGQSVSESGSFQSDGSFLEGFSGANMSLARYTCQALSHLLLHPPKGVDKQRGELRRAAIHLIGRGFTVWEPYMDITKVILALLEVASDTKVDYDLMFNGLPLLPEMDLLQTTHYALTQIATTRPSLFITSLAREVARFSAIMAAAQGPSTLSSSNMPSAVLARSKTEILRNVEILMDKQHHEVENLLLETMDIVLHCLDPGILKNKMLKNVFPSCNKFLAVDHCSTTRRVAAGGRRSVVHLYDSRALRPQVIQGPDEAQEGSSISCLCFSPDGKYLATFLAQLGKILFWQASSSFFNMIAANSFRVVKVAECPRLGISSGPVIKGRRFVTHRMVIILLSDGGEFRFTL
ncbi:WD repeat-containing protein 7-like isoform X3 [Symsagittifera roscoffensis]|uniref:WD repeat-containing protein 7-like isoform X3 n=1 Tax=Symsagittifera roscoffensis TaxID=84072 RepID=UPI00307B6AEB